MRDWWGKNNTLFRIGMRKSSQYFNKYWWSWVITLSRHFTFFTKHICIFLTSRLWITHCNLNVRRKRGLACNPQMTYTNTINVCVCSYFFLLWSDVLTVKFHSLLYCPRGLATHTVTHIHDKILLIFSHQMITNVELEWDTLTLERINKISCLLNHI